MDDLEKSKPIDAKIKEKGWDYEIMPRHGRWLITIYRDEQPVGSIQLDNREDVQLWHLILKGIDNKQFMTEIQKLIPLS